MFALNTPTTQHILNMQQTDSALISLCAQQAEVVCCCWPLCLHRRQDYIFWFVSFLSVQHYKLEFGRSYFYEWTKNFHFFVLCKRGLIPQSFSFPNTNKGIRPFRYFKKINPSNFQILPMNYLLTGLHCVSFISTLSSKICRTAIQI